MNKSVDYVILKLTTSCNLACRYCSAHTRTAAPALLDATLAAGFLEEVLRASQEGACEDVRVLLHGGEPTLYPTTDMRRIMARAEAVAAEVGVRLSYSIQSNGAAISEDWARLIEEKDIGVGLSLDGPAEIHDAVRRTQGGEATYGRVLEALHRLRSRDVPVSVLSVIDGRHVGREEAYADWMCDLGVSVKANPCFPTQGEAATFDSYFDFLKGVFGRLAASPRFQDQHFNPVEDWLATILWGKRMTACSLSGRCSERMLCLAPNGRLSLCGRLLDAGLICETYAPGRLAATRGKMLSEIEGLREKSRAALGCGQCPYVRLCHGGCGMFVQDGICEAWCAAARKYFAYLEGEGLGVLKAGLVQRRARAQAFIAAARDAHPVKDDEN